MAVNYHLRAAEQDYEVAKKIKPIMVDISTVTIDDKNSQKGLLKLTLSITYFFVLAYFLVKLLA